MLTIIIRNRYKSVLYVKIFSIQHLNIIQSYYILAVLKIAYAQCGGTRAFVVFPRYHAQQIVGM